MSKSPKYDKWEIICDKIDGVEVVNVLLNGVRIPRVNALKITRTHGISVEMDLRVTISARDMEIDGENVLLTEFVSFSANVGGDRTVKRLDGGELKEYVDAIHKEEVKYLSNVIESLPTNSDTKVSNE